MDGYRVDNAGAGGVDCVGSCCWPWSWLWWCRTRWWWWSAGFLYYLCFLSKVLGAPAVTHAITQLKSNPPRHHKKHHIAPLHFFHNSFFLGIICGSRHTAMLTRLLGCLSQIYLLLGHQNTFFCGCVNNTVFFLGNTKWYNRHYRNSSKWTAETVSSLMATLSSSYLVGRSRSGVGMSTISNPSLCPPLDTFVPPWTLSPRRQSQPNSCPQLSEKKIPLHMMTAHKLTGLSEPQDAETTFWDQWKSTLILIGPIFIKF